MEAATQAYWKWRRENPKLKTARDDDETTDEEAAQTIDLDQIEQDGIDSLKQYVLLKNAYEFQDLVAALLRGMGYYTPFVAPPGKDGGVDIIAYRDPLGTVTPRIKVQVKHRQGSARVDEVRQLMGLLQKDGDVGMFISTSGFTSDAVSAARGSHVHVELIDLSRFIELWLDFYSKMTDEDKRELPLRPVYFLAQED
jgi:restriction system protein